MISFQKLGLEGYIEVIGAKFNPDKKSDGLFVMKNAKIPIQFIHIDLNFSIFYENYCFSVVKWINFVSPAMDKLEKELNENME